MDRKVKKEFVRRVLDEQAKELNNRQTKAIERYLTFRSGQLLNERKVQVEGGGDSMDGKLVLTIPVHGRFMDMKLKNMRKTNRARLTKIYNSPSMAVFNATGKKLMYFFTKEVAAQINHELNNQNI